MSQHYRQMQHGSDEARRLLHERLARKEMGDAAYDEMVSRTSDRAFKIFGVVFITVFAAIVIAMAALGY